MKTIALVSLLALGLCAGCHTQYDIRMTNGQVITSRGKPHFDKDSNRYMFINANGDQDSISSLRVSQIAPQSMDQDDTSSKKFIPVQQQSQGYHK